MATFLNQKNGGSLKNADPQYRIAGILDV